MIVGNGSKASHIKLKCEDCGIEREIQRNSDILTKSEHPCRICSNKRNGIAKRGRPSWNSGKTFEPKKVGTTYIDYHGYRQIWLGKDESVKYGRKDGYVIEHRKVVQDIIGRPLKKGEIIHHIDGDKLNNVPENLYLCSSVYDHRDIHINLEKVAFELFREGLITFNHESATYELAPPSSNR